MNNPQKNKIRLLPSKNNQIDKIIQWLLDNRENIDDLIMTAGTVNEEYHTYFSGRMSRSRKIGYLYEQIHEISHTD